LKNLAKTAILALKLGKNGQKQPKISKITESKNG